MQERVKIAIDLYGFNKARDLVLVEGYGQVQLHKELGLSNSNSRIGSGTYADIYEYLGIKDIPYKSDAPLTRKFKLEQDRVNGEYWKSNFICDFLFDKLSRPIINMSGNTKRYVISCPRHPKADPDSNQIKAHIIVWELCNERFVPEDHWVVPKDGNYTNLDICNLELRTSISVKSESMIGINNHMYQHGLSGRHKHGGWEKISREHLEKQNYCTICGCKKDQMAVHHIISYHLFKNPIDAHNTINLLVLCQSCHASLHHSNTNIRAHIEETQYCKLLELLETLKSQVPDSLIEIYRDVEKQLGLTDNQQPST